MSLPGSAAIPAPYRERPQVAYQTGLRIVDMVRIPAGRGGQHAPPAQLIKQGITALPCIGNGRQSGTSGSPSVLNASPEAAAAGPSPCCRPATDCASI